MVSVGYVINSIVMSFLLFNTPDEITKRHVLFSVLVLIPYSLLFVIFAKTISIAVDVKIKDNEKKEEKNNDSKSV